MNRYKIHDQKGVYFVTITVVDWVDVFIRKEYKDIVLDSLRYCQQEKGLEVFAYVIMSSHLHLVVRAAGEQDLSDVLRDFKKYTATRIIQAIKTGHSESRREWMLHRFAYHAKLSTGSRTYKFWQSDNHPIELYSLPVMLQKIGYIHQNPVKEGMVAAPHHYPYSSAANYMGEVGLLDVLVVEAPMA